ncbi:unnamed protein product [Tuber melanosporum]|uniref:M-phase inducer phosphatase n=1 Tax=Tuber melanosporum (strain Mel28) TaxID=656061 RepID=D5GFH3_TUBMM|nr:uncharacterized protein GSTUM_00006901001 [Tuber melanosporum]CAZ83266.1 unnamed protein product [Tuber melanosporum]
MEVEASSPLAALQPPSFHRSPWSLASGGFPSKSPRRGVSSNISDSLFGPKLNVRSGMEGTSYFDLGSRLESSPTSSLVADLSQNFHIDKTPQHPTPRRSLFPFGLHGRSSVTTPPIPTSSPIGDAMDISPLPHKPAFQAMRTPMSPTPDLSMSICSSPPSVVPELPRNDPPSRRPGLAERKRSNFTRPPLPRHSRHTSGGVSFKSTSSHSTPTLFGRAATAPQIKLEELFGDSPTRDEKKIGFPGIMASPPPAKPFSMSNVVGNSGSNFAFDGSPVAPLNRPKFNRPKGKVRRTLSMFEHPEDVMQRAGETPKVSMSPPKASPGENSTLPCFTIKDDPLRRINRSVMCRVMDGEYKEHYDEIFVVDCRFEYEYDGGHVAGAINVNSTENLEKLFFNEPKTERVLIVFHCEYSAHRAPRMALHLRSRDRQLNMHRYPALFYPDVYILDGGYSSFFQEHHERCEPQQYVEMNDASHRQACEKEMGKFRRNTKFGRTQSFTFGSHHHDNVESSPSANFGKRSTGGCSKEGMESSFGSRQRSETRRMVSY